VFPVSIQFNSSYSQLLNWLSKAEQNQRKMQVTALSIGKNPEEPSELIVNMEINAYLEK
jgi:type II secretory pathway component PulM